MSRWSPCLSEKGTYSGSFVSDRCHPFIHLSAFVTGIISYTCRRFNPRLRLGCGAFVMLSKGLKFIFIVASHDDVVDFQHLGRTGQHHVYMRTLGSLTNHST
jgi:hypothetical protein